jgi:hypothetical protein
MPLSTTKQVLSSLVTVSVSALEERNLGLTQKAPQMVETDSVAKYVAGEVRDEVEIWESCHPFQ